MLRWLLKYEGYPPGVVFAVLLHAGIIAFMIGREFSPPEPINVEKPVYIAAAIIKENPQQVKRAEQVRQAQQQQQAQERERQRQQQAEAQRRQQAEQERQRQAAAAAEQQRQAQEQETQRQAAAERQRQADAEKARQAEAEKQLQAEAEKQRQAEAEKQRQAEAEKQRVAEAERQRQAEAERQRQAAAAAAAAASAEAAANETNLVSQYAALISQLVSQNWSRPPDATNGMVAVVEIRMAPTGEILASNITQSSGNSNYDRSVDQAVKRLCRVPEMQDLPNAVFERNFRVFSLTFTPEDLLR